MVDVDGSYLHRKQQLVGVESSDVPAVPGVPLTGWELMNNVTNLPVWFTAPLSAARNRGIHELVSPKPLMIRTCNVYQHAHKVFKFSSIFI